MKKAIVCIGVSASGKSTWTKEFIKKNPNWTEVNRDNIRATILRNKKQVPFTWKAWNWKWEDEVTEVQWQMINMFAVDAVGSVEGIIISDTNLSAKRNAELKRKLEALGFEVEFKHFEVSFQEALKRDGQRENGVGAHILGEQFERWHQLVTPQYTPIASTPKAIIVDVDGTIAHMKGRRGPFEWDKVHLDEVDEEVVIAIKGFKAVGHKVIIVSGRDGSCWDKTYAWVQDALGFSPDGFFMRKPGDTRGDDLVKQEIFDKHIANNYDVRAVFDDRPRVTRFWRSIGLKVFQLGNPHVEF